MLLQELVSPDYQFRICRLAGCFPTHKATARRWANEPPPPENREAFLKMVPYLNPNPRVFALHEILHVFDRAVERALLGRATPEAALKEAAKQINGILERQRRKQGKGRYG